MSEKIQPTHLSRKAILYVRQSSAYQVSHNEESRRLQYGMQARLHTLGWSQVDVVDEDLGRSAAGGDQRLGFERLVSEVCLGKVGAVAAREVSRFARNSRDWQQLIEVCRLVGTLLIDHDLQIPVQNYQDGQWRLLWRRPSYETLKKILHNPSYAGFYAYGKTETRIHLEGGAARKKTRPKPREQWQVLIADHHEGYIIHSDIINAVY